MKEILELIQSKKPLSFFWKKINSSLVGIFIGFVILATVIASAFSLLGIPDTVFGIIHFKFYIIISISFLWLAYWVFQWFYIPKNETGSNGDQKKIGIVIAIDDKGEYTGFCLKKDFIDEIRLGLDDKFKLIVLPEKYITGVLDEAKIKELNEKIKGHYWVFGKIEHQKDGGCEKCFIDTNALVFHSPVSEAIQNELSIDFKKLYPENISFSESWYRTGIKFSGKHSAVIAKYIIGVAFLVSGNPFAAQRLHKLLHEEFRKIQKYAEVDANFDEGYSRLISEKIKVIQYHEYRLICNYYYKKKDYIPWNEFLTEWEGLAKFYNLKDLSLLTQLAIYAFLVKKDLNTARKLIKEAGAWSVDESYKYSLIFLDLYNGEYRLAKNRMSEILKKKRLYKYETITLHEVIQFMDDLLLQEPNRFEFIYWQALLFHKKLDNFPMAWEKLNQYISKRGSKVQEYEIYNPNDLRKQIEQKMKIEDIKVN